MYKQNFLRFLENFLRFLENVLNLCESESKIFRYKEKPYKSAMFPVYPWGEHDDFFLNTDFGSRRNGFRICCNRNWEICVMTDDGISYDKKRILFNPANKKSINRYTRLPNLTGLYCNAKQEIKGIHSVCQYVDPETIIIDIPDYESIYTENVEVYCKVRFAFGTIDIELGSTDTVLYLRYGERSENCSMSADTGLYRISSKAQRFLMGISEWEMPIDELNREYRGLILENSDKEKRTILEVLQNGRIPPPRKFYDKQALFYWPCVSIVDVCIRCTETGYRVSYMSVDCWSEKKEITLKDDADFTVDNVRAFLQKYGEKTMFHIF